MKTPFYELAEKIGNEDNKGFINVVWNMNRKEIDFYFSISNHLFDWPVIGKDVMITALLFADLLWQDEMKGGGK